jgi:hypothetical protein
LDAGWGWRLRNRFVANNHEDSEERCSFFEADRKHTSGAKARVDYAECIAGVKTPAYLILVHAN